MMAKRSPPQMTLDSSIAWIAVVIGAVSLLWYFRRRAPGAKGPPQSGQSKPNRTLQETISEGKSQHWRVCVTWDAVAALNGNDLRNALVSLCDVADVTILAKVEAKDASGVLEALRAVGRIERHKVLLCSTDKGLEAFCRQLTPTLLISGKTDLCAGLMRFIPLVAHIGTSALGKNVLDVASIFNVPLLEA